MSLFYGTGEQKFTNERIETRYLSKFIKGEQIRKNMREHGNIYGNFGRKQGSKDAPWETLLIGSDERRKSKSRKSREGAVLLLKMMITNLNCYHF